VIQYWSCWFHSVIQYWSCWFHSVIQYWSCWFHSVIQYWSCWFHCDTVLKLLISLCVYMHSVYTMHDSFVCVVVKLLFMGVTPPRPVQNEPHYYIVVYCSKFSMAKEGGDSICTAECNLTILAKGSCFVLAVVVSLVW